MQQKGPAFEFLKKLALKYDCYVFGGYPEFVEANTFFNSMYCLDRTGTLVLNY